MKKLKIKIKGWLLVKIARYRKQIKTYKEKIADNILKEQEYIDKMNLMQNDIRELLLKLSKEDRNNWLKQKGKEYERYFNKKKWIKK